MGDCSLLGWLNFLALAGTGSVITWYTVETWKLRKEAQLQTELQARPFLSLVCYGIGLDASVLIVNIGKGLARNIHIKDVVVDRSMELRAYPVTHLGVGEEVPGPWKVWVRLTPDDPIGEVLSHEHQSMAGQAITSNEVAVVMRYASIVGQQYETTARVRNGIAEIVEDRRLPARKSTRERSR
jgi:hypothetical protein